MTCPDRPYLSLRLCVRERMHRLTVGVGLTGLVLMSVMPLLAHHLFPAAERWLSGVDDLGALCLVTLHLLLWPVHRLFHLLLLGGFLYATWRRIAAWRLVRRVMRPLGRRVRLAEPGDPFWSAAEQAGVDPRRLRIASGLLNPAFTIGAWRPVIYLTAELPGVLSAEELAAVVAHEGAHLRRRDPLRLSLLRFLADMLFWIPALRSLADDWAEEMEVQADDRAAGRRPLVLASALVRSARLPLQLPLLGVGVGSTTESVLSRRVRRLVGEEIQPHSRLTGRSLAAASIGLLILWTSSVAVLHPLPSPLLAAHAAHCEHAGMGLVAKLEQLGIGSAAHSQACPAPTPEHSVPTHP